MGLFPRTTPNLTGFARYTDEYAGSVLSLLKKENEKSRKIFLFNQSLLGRLIGAGDLGIESAGEHGGQTFEDIRKPRHVQQAIYQAMETDENNRINRMGAAVAGGAAAGSSIPDQIEKLDQLRRQGVLTDAEFNEKKQNLLDRM